MKNNNEPKLMTFVILLALTVTASSAMAAKSEKPTESISISNGLFLKHDISEADLLRTWKTPLNQISSVKENPFADNELTVEELSNLVSAELKGQWNVRLTFIDSPHVGIDVTSNVYRDVIVGLQQSQPMETIKQALKTKMTGAHAVVFLAEGTKVSSTVKDGKVQIGKQWVKSNVCLNTKGTNHMIDEMVRIIQETKEAAHDKIAKVQTK